jgi:16S rRNA (cytosine1402-N4)-methyltransferase
LATTKPDAQWKVPEFAHKPVMLAEVLEALRPTAGERYADGTLGGAGHAAAILAASSPTGWLYGCDRDGDALAAAQARLAAEFAGRFEIRRGNFSELADWVPSGSCAGVLFDLGVSSFQLNQAERGFSFQTDGPLDMRMDDRARTTAADLVNTLSAEELAKIFWEYADERESRRFGKAIVMDRAKNPFVTTRQLAGLIERLNPRRGKTHPATKVFQALRVAVNDELGSLKRGLDGALNILKPGGRLAVITFSSIEDRVTKDFGRARARDYACPSGTDVPELRVPRTPEVKLITRKAIQPGAGEVEENPRARSAQLRVIEKI